jgi:hypothetical protein
MSCPYLKEFWVKIQQILKKSNIENFVTLKHIVFGYKIFDKDYFDFNQYLLYFHPKFFEIGTRHKVM